MSIGLVRQRKVYTSLFQRLIRSADSAAREKDIFGRLMRRRDPRLSA